MDTPQSPVLDALERFHATREEVEHFVVTYRSAIDEIETKVRVLRREFTSVHDYNPIEHVSSRLKGLDSLHRKAESRGLNSLAEIKDNLTDIAGVRITCSFAHDVYRVRDMLCSQEDLTLVQEKDYIREPKESGYRSLHLIVEVPVFLSSRVEVVPVEVQIRTIAMDFWASLEHKIHYKLAGEVPEDLRRRLISAADTAAAMDTEMEALHHEMRQLKEVNRDGVDPIVGQMLRTLSLFERERQ